MIVFGAYDFKAGKPWLQLISNPKILDISESEVEQMTKPYLQSILKEQKIRQDFKKAAK